MSSIDQGARDLAQLAKEQYEDYKSRFLPLEHQFATKQAAEIPAKRDKAVSGAMAQVQSTMAAGDAGMQKNMRVAGIAPQSGKALGSGAAYGGTVGKSAATGAVGANDAVTGQRWAGMTKAMRQGRGQASQSIAGLTSSAYLKDQAAALQRQTEGAIQASNYNMYGSIAGAAAGGAMYAYGGLKPRTPTGSGVSGANMQAIPNSKINIAPIYS